LDYKNIEDWILSRLPSYQAIGKKAYNPGLNNVIKFISALELSLERLNFIHVGGTNGKGSTSAYISSILQESNYKVGIFTSPHFYDFRERIKINNQRIKKSFIINFIEDNKNLIEKLKLSFFELSFCISLAYFIKSKVDYSIIEVGLGGRLDATNIIDPLISVITNISFDHTDILGNTLEMIANEKAGIFKQNSKIIIGERNDIVDEIFVKKAKEMSSTITFVPDYDDQKNYSNVIYLNNNIKTAIYTCKALNLNNVNNDKILAGISNIKKNSQLIGRWTTVSNNPKIIFDAAHNLAGFESISSQLLKTKYNQLHVILAFIKGKNINELISTLPSNSNIYFTSINMERGMGFSEIIQNVGRSIIFDKNPKRLLDTVKMRCSDQDLILITGSNFIAKSIL
jgi:dihydrofolate synthase/folylpolyglutamate synthase|tara:strand:- start:4225 stop:5421 length:1197 start_codon:yes stop_codon:yes gene_type:complete